MSAYIKRIRQHTIANNSFAYLLMRYYKLYWTLNPTNKGILFLNLFYSQTKRNNCCLILQGFQLFRINI